MDKRRVIIIGSGPAGLTSAIYTARADLEPLVIAGAKPGGQLMYTGVVENFPGFPEGTEGPGLMMALMKQAEKFGAELVNEDAISVEFSSKPLKISTRTQAYETDSVIIATGASNRKLKVPGEEKLFGKGISICATCDAAFFRDKTVVVVGGGDAAMEEALVLSKYASSVTIVIRDASLRAGKFMSERVSKNEKIQLMYNTSVVEIYGDAFVTGVRLKNNETNEERDFDCAGVFVAIGHVPNTHIFTSQLELNDRGFIESSDGIHTNLEGVFVAGDAQDFKYRQAITAAGLGCMAALEAERFLEGNRV